MQTATDNSLRTWLASDQIGRNPCVVEFLLKSLLGIRCKAPHLKHLGDRLAPSGVVRPDEVVRFLLADHVVAEVQGLNGEVRS